MAGWPSGGLSWLDTWACHMVVERETGQQGIASGSLFHAGRVSKKLSGETLVAEWRWREKV